MLRLNLPFPRTGMLAVAVAAGLLTGCAGRDAESAERIAEMNAAAVRAEKAAERAEAAVAKLQNAATANPHYEPEAAEPSPLDPSPPEDQPINEL